MPKAENDLITGDRVVAPETAVAAIARTAPSILDLGRQLAAVEAAHDVFDWSNLRHCLKAEDTDAERRLEQRSKAAWIIQEDRMEALRELISSMPAVTIQDAAVQLSIICDAASRLSASIHTQQQMEEIADRIERMALGILPIVAKAAGLGIAEMNWGDYEDLRVRRFDGVGVTS